MYENRVLKMSYLYDLGLCFIKNYTKILVNNMILFWGK